MKWAACIFLFSDPIENGVGSSGQRLLILLQQDPSICLSVLCDFYM